MSLRDLPPKPHLSMNSKKRKVNTTTNHTITSTLTVEMQNLTVYKGEQYNNAFDLDLTKLATVI